MSNVIKKKRITWADFAVPAIVCMISTRIIFALSFVSFAKWAAINSGYYRVYNFTIVRKFTHLIYTCINAHILLSTISIWLLAILTYLIIRRKFHSHIIWVRIVYFICWLLILLLTFYLVINYAMIFILPNL